MLLEESIAEDRFVLFLEERDIAAPATSSGTHYAAWSAFCEARGVDLCDICTLLEHMYELSSLASHTYLV